MKESEYVKMMLPVRDALEVLSGKWKLQIIIALTFSNMRFKEMQRNITGVTPKMLSKELKELERNQLVKRSVFDTIPVTVEYSLTTYGKTLRKVINELGTWGRKHRDKVDR